MNWHKIIVTCFFLIGFISIDILAQQDAQYTHYMFNQFVVNPAYAGSRDAISTMALYRHQWGGIDEAPRTVSLSAHGPLNEKVGLGLYLENDHLGVHNRTNVFAAYSYRITVNEGVLSMGLQAGFLRYASNWTDTDLIDAGDDLFSQDEARLLPNFGFGVYYYTDTYYIGASVPHLINSKQSNDDYDVQKIHRRNRHYFLTAGLIMPLADDITMMPSVMIKSVPAKAPISADINCNFIYQERFMLGASYRVADSFDFLVQYQHDKNLRIGYSYDLTMTKLRNHTSGSHEIMLGYDFGFDPDKAVSPRHF